MDFRITEDQAALVEGIRDYLTGVHGPEALRIQDAQGGKRSAAIWSGLVAMGLPGLLIPEAQGGLGLGFVEGALIAVECGRAALAEPLVDTALIAAPLLALAGGQEALLEAIARGDAVIALSHQINPWVADLEGASHVIVVMGRALGLVTPPRGAERTDSVDPLRRLYRPIKVDGRAVEGAADDLLDIAALMKAAELVGLADAMLAISIAYAEQRSQFGQPIGSFQAIKHHLASATVKIEFAKPVVLRAAVALEEGSEYRTALVSHAKLAASDAALLMSETAIQVHGAMGYTYEVDLHFWMKRSWALIGAWGDEAFHTKRVGDAVIDGTMPLGPAATFA